MLVCVIFGWLCVIVVIHAGIVDGEPHCAKREDHAESNKDEVREMKEIACSLHAD
jgi:hypothetical protein